MNRFKEFVKRHIDTDKFDRRVERVKKLHRDTRKKFQLLLGYRATAFFNTLFGKNPKDIHYVKRSGKGKNRYLVIRSEYPRMGLFSTLLWSVPAIEWAERFGYIPVIDWELPYTFLNDEIGHYDYWGRMFDQGISPSECVKTGKTLISATNFSDYPFLKKYGEMFWVNNLADKERTARVKQLVKDTVFKPMPEFIKNIREEFNITSPEQNILGLMVREEFCKSSKKYIIDQEQKRLLEEHPNLPEIGEILEMVKRLKEQWKCEYIFLSCACSDTVDIFKEEFGDRLLFVNRNRRTLQGQYVDIATRAYGENDSESLDELFPIEDVLKKESTYFQEIYMLSQCDYLIGSGSGGYVGTMLLKEGEYKDSYLIPYV